MHGAANGMKYGRVACALLVLSGAAQAEPARQLHDLKDRIRQVQKDVTETEGSRRDALDGLKKIERDIARTTRNLRQLEDQKGRLQQELGGLHQETDALRSVLDKQQDGLGTLVVQRYQASFADALNTTDPQQAEAQRSYLGQLAQDRAHAIAGSRSRIQSLNDMTQAHERKVQELARVEQEVGRQQARLKEENAAKATWVATLSHRLESQRQNLSALQRDEARLTHLMEKLARQAEERRRRQRQQHPARAEKPRPRQSGDSTVAIIRETPEPGLDDSAFAHLRGALRLPVAGELRNRFGSPRIDTGLKWSGLFIRCPAGRDVKAVAAGKVVYADWLRGFGNVLIIDHGGGYMSLYGGGDHLRQSVGATVERGSVVATTGNTGGQDETGLYFELRYQGKPFDPLGWVGHP